MIPNTEIPGKFRTIGIPSINDRLVQAVIKKIIEPIFELNFAESSHGLRANRSLHTAFKYINKNIKNNG
jgi:retron-type reverse transcriptase